MVKGSRKVPDYKIKNTKCSRCGAYFKTIKQLEDHMVVHAIRVPKKGREGAEGGDGAGGNDGGGGGGARGAMAVAGN